MGAKRYTTEEKNAIIKEGIEKGKFIDPNPTTQGEPVRTEERPRMELQPTGEMYTVYLSDDGEWYNTSEEALKRDEVLAKRKLVAEWAHYEFSDRVWYRVRNAAEVQTLTYAMNQQYDPNWLYTFPALIRWEYNNNSRWDDFQSLTLAELTGVLGFMEGKSDV